MKSSWHIGSVSGIKITVHWTFLLLIVWIIYKGISSGSSTTEILWSTLFIAALFGCIILHELGHSLTAMKYNIKTRRITLLPIGGVASLESMPDESQKEFMIAIAGPIVNIVIALLLYLVVPLHEYANMEAAELEQALSTINAGNFLFYMLFANLMLAVFNMIPAFPMDGGRVLRALIAMKFDRVRATQIATRLGQLVAFFLLFLGLVYNPILILIAIFVYFGAHGENVMVQQLVLLKNYAVKDAMMTDITTFNPDDPLDKVVDVIISGTQRDFVVTKGEMLAGVLLQSDLIAQNKSDLAQKKVGDVMRKDIKILHAQQKLTEIYRQIRSSDKKFFPVIEDDELVGAIDMTNINEFMIFRGDKDF